MNASQKQDIVGQVHAWYSEVVVELYHSLKFLIFCLLTFFGNTIIIMIMIEIQYRGGLQRVPWTFCQ